VHRVAIGAMSVAALVLVDRGGSASFLPGDMLGGTSSHAEQQQHYYHHQPNQVTRLIVAIGASIMELLHQLRTACPQTLLSEGD
jgi:hypothetical protein